MFISGDGFGNTVVAGTSTLMGNTTVGGTLGVTGASTLTGNTEVNGTLTVDVAGNDAGKWIRYRGWCSSD